MSSSIQFQNLYGYQIANILEKEMRKQSKKNEINYHYNNNNYFTCNYCNKKYKNKLKFDKHCLLCESSQDNLNLNLNLNDTLNTIASETTPIISNQLPHVNTKINDCLLIELLKDLLVKYNKLSNEMAEIKKWISKEKKQINILDWLNNHNPIDFQTITSFDGFINNFMISEEYIKKITTSNILDVYLYSIEDLFSIDTQDLTSSTTNPILQSSMPICCFNQKANVFYIYTEISSNSTTSQSSIEFHWREAKNEDILRIFNKIKNKLISELCKWNDFQQNLIAETTPNHNQYNASKEKTDEIFNKSILKLMTDISNNSIFQKLKSKLYHKLKTDIKQYVEYEFKFNP
jgi:succinate dehydrogenase/fumarate reductase-like Fe-S protein